MLERVNSGGRCDDSTLVNSFENGASREADGEESGISRRKEESDVGLCAAYDLNKISSQRQRSLIGGYL